MDAALQADFGGAALPRLARAAGDFVDFEVVGGAAQVLVAVLPLEKAQKAQRKAQMLV